VLNIRAHATHDANEALTLARRLTPAHGVIVATGSIYLVGAVREAVLEP
jgi:folylpolyglutamate synthase/dihydropteroate synthase